MDALVLAPIPRTSIWAAKAIGIAALLVLMEAVAVPLSYLFLPADAPVPHVGTLLLALVAGDVGLAALGSLVAAVASAVRGPRGHGPAALPAGGSAAADRGLACSVHASSGEQRRAASGPGTALRCHRRPARIRRMRARPDRLTPVGIHDRLLRPAVLAAGSLLVLSTLLIALWVPSDRAEGYRQRIFYLHVPIALTAYLFLLIGAFYAARYLMRRDPMDDLRSYVAIHQGVILGTLVLITGPIWAKVSWGIWWDWSDKQLNTFLLVFLFYCAYFMLRYSVDEGARRERFSAIYALLGIGMVPLSLAAVHLAGTLHHPTVFHRDGPAMENSMFVAFLVSWAAFILLGLRALAARAARQAARPGRAAPRAPAARRGGPAVILATISNSDAQAVGAVVAAIWGVTLAYVWILASKLRRLEQQLAAAQAALDRAQGTDPA